MAKLFSKGHAEPGEPGTEAKRPQRYLPHFAVFHPRKSDNICVVFDSSATHHDVSQNKVLVPGPHLVDSLLVVLVRVSE